MDELCSAAPTVTAPAIQADLGLGVASLASMALVLPVLLALVVEPAAMWLADGPWRRPLLIGSTLTWSASFAFAAQAESAWSLGVALLFAGPASGVTLGVARIALLSRNSNPERVLTRWTLWASAGDLAGPLLIALLFSVGGSWRQGFLTFAGILAVYALLCSVVPLGRTADEAQVSSPFWPTVRQASTDRPLLIWLLATSLCTLLDEIMIVLSTLRVSSLPGGSPGLASLGAAAFLAGTLLGLLVLERGWIPVRLPWACTVSLLGLLLVILARDTNWTTVGLFVTGLGAGPQYPVALARAHARRPDRPGLVSALSALLTPLDLALPLLVGLWADRFGLGPALALLAFQPLGILIVVFTIDRKPRLEHR